MLPIQLGGCDTLQNKRAKRKIRRTEPALPAGERTRFRIQNPIA